VRSEVAFDVVAEPDDLVGAIDSPCLEAFGKDTRRSPTTSRTFGRSHQPRPLILIESQSVEAKDREQAFVNPPDLLGAGVPDGISQTVHVHGSYLFDENPRRPTFDHELRSEGCWACAGRRGCHQDNRARQQRIGLDDDSKSATSLLMPHTLWQSQLVYVTPEHGDSP